MLQYDNSAFYFFALSTLSVYLVPSWYSIIGQIRKVYFGLSDKDIGAVSRTSAEKQKVQELKKARMNSLKSKGFLINLAITVFFTLVSFYLIVSVSTDGEVNTFDPFSILEIDSGSDSKQIKRAYRTLSLKFHPDKNPNNPAAEAKFMMVSKAYEALTDPEAKENYEKYGNPDGKQSLAVSIGLPSFLLDPSYRNLVLMTYLIIMVGVIPFCVWKYYSRSSKFGERDVMYDTYSWFSYTLNEHTTVKSMPEILAGSAEFRECNMPKTNQEKEEIAAYMSQVKSQMQKPKYNHPVCVKGNVLMHMYLLRQTDKLSEEAMADLKVMLKRSTSLIEAMISVCQHQDTMQTAMNCIEFGQYVAQAMWVRDSTLLQLPHFTSEEVKHCLKGKNKASSLSAYRAIPDDQKKGMANFTDQQKEDVLTALQVIPELEVKTKVFVDDDEDDNVYEGDLCTVQVTITRKNLKEGQLAGPAHAPHFPLTLPEAWWIALGTKEGKIVSIDKVVKPEKTFVHNIKFMAPRQGDYEFDLYVKSSAYLDLDQKLAFKMKTLDNSTLPEYKVHPDDANLEEEPTLFEDMLNANVEEDSDSDEEDSDDSDEDSDDEKIKELTPEERKKEEMRRARAGQDSDDDDSDAEEVYAEK